MIRIRERIAKLKGDRLVSIAASNSASGSTITYHVSSFTKPKINQVKLEVPKGETVESIMGLFSNAAIFEAEATELYGVKFEGNPMSGKRLFTAGK